MSIVRGWLDRLAPVPTRRELSFVLVAVIGGILIRLAYIAATKDHRLAGDEVEYDLEARLTAMGHWFYSTTPYGDNVTLQGAAPSTWKAPGYGLFAGILYKLLGSGADKTLAAQAVLLGPAVIVLTWLFARRFFGITAGVLAALLVAVYPNAWQFDVRLYSEALANPLTTLALFLMLTTIAVTWRRVWTVGLVMGVLLLIRPSSLLLFAGILVIWLARGGFRLGLTRFAATVGVAALVVLPWSVRNLTLDGPWVPISVQSAAGYGVFNADSAADGVHPWAWRPLPKRDEELFKTRRTDGELYKELNSRMFDYIKDNPSSVPKAFYWNGIRRLWDLRSPADAVYETQFEGRTDSITKVGLYMYWVLVLLALGTLVGFVRSGRRDIVLALAAVALAASVVYTTDGGTRYRAPLEPLIVVLAVGAVAPLLSRRPGIERALGGAPRGAGSPPAQPPGQPA